MVARVLQTLCMHRRYAACMATIQVRNVSDATHAVLRRRAGTAGMSLQEYLSRELDELAARPTVAEVLGRAGERSGGDLPGAMAVDLVRSDRDAR